MTLHQLLPLTFTQKNQIFLARMWQEPLIQTSTTELAYELGHPEIQPTTGIESSTLRSNITMMIHAITWQSLYQLTVNTIHDRISLPTGFGIALELLWNIIHHLNRQSRCVCENWETRSQK
jgi:hypothetical protein